MRKRTWILRNIYFIPRNKLVVLFEPYNSTCYIYMYVYIYIYKYIYISQHCLFIYLCIYIKTQCPYSKWFIQKSKNKETQLFFPLFSVIFSLSHQFLGCFPQLTHLLTSIYTFTNLPFFITKKKKKHRKLSKLP